MHIFRRGRSREIVPKSLSASVEVGAHERILTFEMPVKGGFGYVGDGHDFLRSGGADSLGVKEAFRDFHDPRARINILALSHEIYLDMRQTCLSIISLL